MNELPFILLESRFAFYVDGESGKVWMGGEAEKVTCSRTFKERLLYVDGARHGRGYHEDESHEVKLENLWSLHLDTLKMPQPGRNVTLVLVLVWFDQTAMAWAKRTYYGVTANNQDLTGDPTRGGDMQSLQFRAERLVESAGSESAPDMNPEDDQSGWLRLVNGNVVLGPVATLSETSELVAGAYEAVSVESVDGVVSLTILGSLAATLSAEGLTCNDLLGIGGTFPSTGDARIEFILAGRRLASLTKGGMLAAAGFFEVEEAPALTLAPMRLKSGSDWICSLGPNGLYAPSFTTPLP